MSEWNDAIDAAIHMIDHLGADRPRDNVPQGDDRELRTRRMIEAQHQRARTIRIAVAGLKR